MAPLVEKTISEKRGRPVSVPDMHGVSELSGASEQAEQSGEE